LCMDDAAQCEEHKAGEYRFLQLVPFVR
jgi:hypothetical protein